MSRSLTASEVRHGKAYTPAHVFLMGALNRAGIAYLSEHAILTDIWEPAHQRLKTYTVDVFIRPNLCVEVDGLAHGHGRQWLKDERREQWLRSKGYRVVRFPNERVMRETDAVVEEIRKEMGR